MADRETIVGPETRISGELRGEEDLVVRGRIEGRIQLTQSLTIEDGGIVQADVDVRRLIVSGVLVGNVIASEAVRLTAKARVVGDVTAPSFVMEAGASYRGRVEAGEGAAAGEGRRATADRTDNRPAPPRMSTPSRTASAPPPRMAPPAPPRIAAAGNRPAPMLARPDVAAAGGATAPGWAKKKLRRR